MASHPCYACGEPLHEWKRERLPICLRCRDLIGDWDHQARAEFYLEVVKARDLHYTTAALQNLSNAMRRIADRVEETSVEIIEDDDE